MDDDMPDTHVAENTKKIDRATSRASKSGRSLPTEYGRLELLAPIPLPNGGGECSEVVIYRPSCRVMTEVLDTPRLQVQIERFVDGCCRAVNGGGDPVAFSPRELSSIDGSELASVIQAMSEDADQVLLDESGDGITSPLVYTLQRPIKMSNLDDAETVHQFAFEARKVGDIGEFLDARGETREFHTFMRVFGKPLGLRVAIMTDTLINAIDFLDYLVIRRQIMGKFINSRRRFTKASSLVH